MRRYPVTHSGAQFSANEDAHGGSHSCTDIRTFTRTYRRAILTHNRTDYHPRADISPDRRSHNNAYCSADYRTPHSLPLAHSDHCPDERILRGWPLVTRAWRD